MLLGVPVSPTTRFSRGRSFKKAFVLWLFALKEESSSRTAMSKSRYFLPCCISHTRFSRLMMYISASALSAASRSAGVPMTTEYLSSDRWSHFLISSGHVLLATRRGATTRTLLTSKRLCRSSSMAVRVIAVLPSTQAHIQDCSCNRMGNHIFDCKFLIIMWNELH